jgi:hypothetical protein
MTTALDTPRNELPIVMKGGLVHWVKEETWRKISQILETQTAHGFIRIRELDVTLNSADIEGAYTLAQYGDIEKVKQGMWQCAYRNWHNKGKRECDCAAEAEKKRRLDEEARQREEDNRPLSEEEREKNKERLLLSTEEAALRQIQEGKPDGIFASMFRKGNLKRRRIRQSTIDSWIAKNGPVETKTLSISKES